MEFAKQVAVFSAMAEQKGMVNSLEGNLSVMDRETGNIYITPSHKAKLLLTPEEICVIAPDGTQIGGTGKRSSDCDTPQDTFLRTIFGKIPRLPYGAHGTHEIHQGIEQALQGRPVVLLGGHGAVCVGQDLEDALGIMEAAENYAKTIYIKHTMK